MEQSTASASGPHGSFQNASAIFRRAVAAADPQLMVRKALSRSGSTLSVRNGSGHASYDLDAYGRILVVSIGKAAGAMAVELESILEDRISDGLISTKSAPVHSFKRLKVLEAGHPEPDEVSCRAARDVLDLARTADERTLVITLLSGGGSALFCAPFASPSGEYGVTLAEKQAVTKALLASGVTIHGINCVRKHLSSVKGGRLAEAFSRAACLNLIVSDVVGDHLDVIASGPTVPDPTTFDDALAIVRKYGLEGKLPPAAISLLKAGSAGAIPETPKPGNPCFTNVRNMLIGTNHEALLGAERKAIELGYNTLLLTSQLAGEAREVALVLLGIGKDIRARGRPLARPACVILGGETTVTIRGRGKGGRNQETALAFLAALARAHDAGDGLSLLAASTDGIDGPTDAAGAFSSREMLERARACGLDPDEYLRENDSYTFFDGIGGLLRTGTTNTNVSDIQILIVE